MRSTLSSSEQSVTRSSAQQETLFAHKQKQPHQRGASTRGLIDRRTSSLIASFGHAFAGLHYFFTTQRNAQIHALVAACALVLGMALGLRLWEWLALVVIITLVLVAEGINTAIEAAVDVATSEYHPLARTAKDVAAGSVLLCALSAVLVGCMIFLPHLWPIVLWIAEQR
jgi:diacylglycerol kinase (ATP)